MAGKRYTENTVSVKVRRAFYDENRREVIPIGTILERSKGWAKKNQHLVELVKIAPGPSAAPTAEADPGDDENAGLAGMSKTALKKLAKEAGVAGYSRMERDDLIAALEALEG